MKNQQDIINITMSVYIYLYMYIGENTCNKLQPFSVMYIVGFRYL